REWARLTESWIAAEREGARLVMVAGEPGIGKTRLAEELRGWCERRGAATAWARSYSAEGALPYAPVVEWLRTDVLYSRLRTLDANRRADLARLLPELKATDAQQPQTDDAPDTDGRRRLFDATQAALLAGGRPMLLVLDDAQWCDRETLQLV